MLSFKILFFICFAFLSFKKLSYSNEIEKDNCLRAKNEFKKILKKDIKNCELLGENEKRRVFKITDTKEKEYTIRYLKNIQGLPDVKEKDAKIETEVAKILSDKKIAPKLLYANLKDGVIISKFIKNKPFMDKDWKVEDKFVKSLTKKLLTMHQQVFPYRDNIFDRIQTRLEKAKNFLSKEEYDICESFVKQTKEIFSNHPNIGGAHRDLIFNVLNSIKNEAYFIDFESASQDDIFYDIASVDIFFLKEKKHKDEFLKIYFGKNFDEKKKAKFFLAKQTVYLYTAIRNFLNHQSLGEVHKNFILDKSKKKTFDSLMKERAINNGQFKIKAIEDCFILGNSLVDEFLKNVKSEEFKNAIKILSN